MENNNHGILVGNHRASDYVLGVNSKVETTRSVKDWSLYMPTFESQKDQVTDFLDCLTFSAGHSIEMQLNYLLNNNFLSDEALNFFHNGGYIVDGVFRISKRFNAKMNGTDKLRGNYSNAVAESFRIVGFVADKDWPMTDTMGWDEYYKTIPINLIEKAKKALWFLNISYQLINSPDIQGALPLSPIQVATEVCAGWDSGQIVQKCSGQPLQHATILYGRDSQNNWLDLDQYFPFKQLLAPDYEFPSNLQLIISLKPMVLRQGMQGVNVLNLQDDLNSFGYKLDNDSFYGPHTTSAVTNFQKNHGLTADGIAGPITLGKIKDVKDTPSIKDIIRDTCLLYGIEPELGIAVATAESGLNPKSVNKNTNGSVDNGLFQWNNRVFPSITETQAFDPATATKLFCDAVNAGHLHAYWYLSEPNWKKDLSSDILDKYHIKN